ncbi:MAG: sigma-70 family RNA polymerase sigma factor [Bacteroidia bacterium]
MSAGNELNSHSSISQWLNDYGDDMYSWAYYKTSSKETAEDLVQETMLSAYKSFDKYKPGSNPKTWLYTILNNKIIDYYRASNTKKSVNETELAGKRVEDDNFDNGGAWNKAVTPLWANTEEHLLDNQSFLEVLNMCISNLPQQWRGVIQGKYFDHKKGAEISKELGISSSNLWQMAYRAKLQLKNCLEINWKE